MNFRSTAILFGILFVVGIALLVMSFSESEPTASGDRVLAFASDIKAKDIDTIEFEKGSARLIVKRQDENHWSILQPITARADANAIDRDIDALLQLKATAHGELSANPAAHGLEPPSLRVTLRAGDTSETVNIGDVTGGSKAVAFVTTSNRARPMAVSRGRRPRQVDQRLPPQTTVRRRFALRDRRRNRHQADREEKGTGTGEERRQLAIYFAFGVGRCGGDRRACRDQPLRHQWRSRAAQHRREPPGGDRGRLHRSSRRPQTIRLEPGQPRPDPG
jgi:hypothetical protein